jgi:hypothetical protein
VIVSSGLQVFDEDRKGNENREEGTWKGKLKSNCQIQTQSIPSVKKQRFTKWLE